jgi:hypothetical protein
MATTKQQKKPASHGLLDRLFLEHPRSLGMSWASHGTGAVKVGIQLIGAGLAAIVHGLIPGVFGETASRTVTRVYDHIQRTRGKPTDAG